MAQTEAIRNPKKRAFLKAFSRIGFIVKAAKAAKIHFSSHYEWLAHDPDYRAAFEEAKEASIETLEETAWKRATDKKKPSDVLLIFLLKAARPDVYRERQEHQHTGRVEQEHTVRVVRDDNWYGNAHRLAAHAAAASNGSPAASGPVQVGGVRPAVGQNGNGSASRSKRSRPETNGHAGSD